MSGEAELRERIKELAIENALKHNGRADPGSVLGKLLASHSDLKPRAKDILGLVISVCNEVNSMSPDALKAYEVKEEKRKEQLGLPPLPDATTGSVVTRFAPNPNSVLHLGSARAAVLSYEYAKMYSGKFILRFEDTDPRLKRSDVKFYEMIKEDLRWLGIHWDEEYLQSERLEIYYEYARKALEAGIAYITECDRETFRKRVLEGVACPERSEPPEKQLGRWESMLSGKYKEGEAVLRVKTDLSHPNPAVRDWPAFRIIDPEKHAHPIVGKRYRVWPLYNWAAAIDDHLLGITHILRGQEHFVNMIRQKYLYDGFGWRYPVAIHYGRLLLMEGALSKSEIEKGIKEGRFTGYDDPRLMTLTALRRRGIRPEAITSLIISMGINTNDAVVDTKNLLAINRKLIDPISNRYFAVFRPRMVRLEGIPGDMSVSLPRHPSFKERGTRKLEVSSKNPFVYIEEDDFGKNIGREARLIGLGNFIFADGILMFTDNDLTRAKGLPHIHWVPEGQAIKASILMDDGSTKDGICEANILEERPDSVVQFERLFFARLERVSEEGVFAVYTSD